MSSKALQSVLITVDDQHHKLDQVALDLKKAGLVDVEVMRFSGIIGGSVPNDLVAELEKVEGVEHIEFQKAFHAS